MSQHTLSQSLALERGGAWSAVNILWSALNPQVPYWTESVRIAPSAEQRLSGLCETKWRSCCMKNWCKIWVMLMKHYETWFMSPFCNVQVHASRDTTAPPSGGENVFWDKQMINKRSKKMCPPILYLVLGRSLVASLHGSMEVWNCLNSKCEQIHLGMNNSCPISKVQWSRSLEIWGLSCSLWLITPLLECLPKWKSTCDSPGLDKKNHTNHDSCTPLDSSLTSLKHREGFFWDLKKSLKLCPLPLALFGFLFCATSCFIGSGISIQAPKVNVIILKMNAGQLGLLDSDEGSQLFKCQWGFATKRMESAGIWHPQIKVEDRHRLMMLIHSTASAVQREREREIACWISRCKMNAEAEWRNSPAFGCLDVEWYQGKAQVTKGQKVPMFPATDNSRLEIFLDTAWLGIEVCGCQSCHCAIPVFGL